VNSSPAVEIPGGFAGLLGRVGQWGTLGACAAILSGLAALAVLALPRLRAERVGDMTWSDFVSAPRDRPVYVDGCVEPAVPANDAPLAIAAGLANRRVLSSTRRGRSLGLLLASIGVGLSEAPVVGTPYGPLAYRRDAIKILGVPMDRPLWLVDARLLEQLRDDEVRDLLAVLEREGAAAGVHVGLRSDFASVRRRLNDRFPRLPLVGQSGQGRVGVRRVVGDVQTYGRRRPAALTADAATAAELARAGAKVHLVGQAVPADAPKGIVKYASLDEFKEKLPSGPIGQ